MKELLKAVFAELKTVPAIKWIDEDFGQIDNYEGKPPVQFPCALVSIDDQFDSLGGDEYDVSGTVTIRVAHNRLGDRSAMANSEAVDNTMNKLDDVEAVVSALIGLSIGGVCGTLYIKSIVTERRTDGIAVKTITFTETH